MSDWKVGPEMRKVLAAVKSFMTVTGPVYKDEVPEEVYQRNVEAATKIWHLMYYGKLSPCGGDRPIEDVLLSLIILLEGLCDWLDLEEGRD